MTPPQAPESADDGGAFNNVESAQNKPELCPTRNREVVNLSGLAETKD